MIRLLENNSGISLYQYINYAGHNWFVVEIQGDLITLLAADLDFGFAPFQTEKHVKIDYQYSSIRKYIDSQIVPKLIADGAQLVPDNSEYSWCGSKAGFLYASEIAKFPRHIRAFRYKWWTMSKGKTWVGDASKSNIQVVYDSGTIDDHGEPASEKHAIRLAIKVRAKALTGGSKVEVRDKITYNNAIYCTVVDISRNIATLLMTWTSPEAFNSADNNYKKSSIRKYLKNHILPILTSKGMKIVPTTLSDIGCRDQVWLPSLEEWRKWSDILNLPIGEYYWLRTPGKTPDTEIVVGRGGEVSEEKVNSKNYLVTAVRVKMSDLEGNFTFR